jgi:hypothetical protein
MKMNSWPFNYSSAIDSFSLCWMSIDNLSENSSNLEKIYRSPALGNILTPVKVCHPVSLAHVYEDALDRRTTMLLQIDNVATCKSCNQTSKCR